MYLDTQTRNAVFRYQAPFARQLPKPAFFFKLFDQLLGPGVSARTISSPRRTANG